MGKVVSFYSTAQKIGQLTVWHAITNRHFDGIADCDVVIRSGSLGSSAEVKTSAEVGRRMAINSADNTATTTVLHKYITVYTTGTAWTRRCTQHHKVFDINTTNTRAKGNGGGKHCNEGFLVGCEAS